MFVHLIHNGPKGPNLMFNGLPDLAQPSVTIHLNQRLTHSQPGHGPRARALPPGQGSGGGGRGPSARPRGQGCGGNRARALDVTPLC